MLPNLFANITIPNYDAELTALTRKWAKQAVADKQARRDPALRVAMTELVIGLEQLIADIGDAAALKTAGDDAFAADEMRELLIWQLTEFLTGAQIERGDDSEVYQEARRWYQVSERHAATWFETTRIGSTWEIVAAAEPLDAQQAASAPAVEPPAPDLRALVADGLRDRGWIEQGEFCNPFTGAMVDLDADLPALLSIITGEDIEEDTPLTLQDVINKLIGSPVAPPKPENVYQVIDRLIEDNEDATLDELVAMVMREKPLPADWEEAYAYTLRNRIDETLAERRGKAEQE